MRCNISSRISNKGRLPARWRATEVRSESLTWLQLLAPTLFVFGALYLLANIFPVASRWGRYLIFVTVWSVVFWYLRWRFFETVLPTNGYWYEIGWVWF